MVFLEPMTPELPMNTNGNLGTESPLGQALGLRSSISLSNNPEALVEEAGLEPPRGQVIQTQQTGGN